jgi:ubiquinone biosynthesis protein Coq4
MKRWLYGLQLARASWRLVKDPTRLEEVFAMFDSLRDANRTMLQEMADEARQTASGARALAERPRLGRVDPAELGRLPAGTLGRAHADFLRARNLDPAALPVREAADEPAYVEAHLYETHDVWHTVTGFDTDVAGELGLQAFYAAQNASKLPFLLLALGLLNTLLYGFGDRHRRLEAIAWGYQQGRRARPLFGVRWAQLWDVPLDEVRRELHLEPVPVNARAPAPAAPAAPAAEARQLATA